VVSLPLVLEFPALIAEYAPNFRGSPMELPETTAQAFGTYRNRLKLQGVKMALDGSPQGKTAFWTEPLLTGGPEGEADWVGFPLFPPEIVNPVVAEFVDKGIQIFTHANGDAAIDMMIDAIRAAGVTAADGRRDVVIHSQFMRPDQLDAYVELGLSPSFFTAHTFFWGDIHVENTGPERAAFTSPMASALARGLRCSNHSDFSVTPIDPMRMMHSSTTRRSRSGAVIGGDVHGALDDHRRGVADLRGGHQGLARARQARRPRDPRPQPARGRPGGTPRDPGDRDLQEGESVWRRGA
jgi:predicted amidohydrolase YtcJ